jgi:hypothetical protein
VQLGWSCRHHGHDTTHVRAYPERSIEWHEVVNDQLGGEAIAVSYCPLCGTGVAFTARVSGSAAMSFGVLAAR